MLQTKNLKTILIGISLLAVLMSNSCKKETKSMEPDRLGPLKTIQMNLGGVTVEIEVAVTPREQMQGLMYRESMPENHGMLFVYNEPDYMSFWMKNTKIPLSIAYIREDGIIGNILDMKPYTGLFDPTEHYPSKYESLYALEMNQGWYAKHNVKAR